MEGEGEGYHSEPGCLGFVMEELDLYSSAGVPSV
jgi:hypothetical protein